jgi:tRNA threonylcarbamoyladenosine biosynthesis protein TsaE
MTTLKIELPGLADTERFGRILGENVQSSDVICLDGDLGAGKTTLVQAIARGLGVGGDCYVTSPSFSILHEYSGRLPLYHMDFYRLGDAGEVEDLGFEEYFYGTGVCVIEWSVRATELLPETRLSLDLSINEDLSRTATVRSDACPRHLLVAIGEFL